MQTATITLALGGDTGNTIQKFGVTPSEVAVLQVIHGNDAISDIVIDGEISRTNRAERERLSRNYGKPQADGTLKAPAVDMLFPGVAARLYENFSEMEIEESYFRDVPAEAADTAVAEPAAEIPLEKMTKLQLITVAEDMGVEISETDAKSAILAAIKTAIAQDAEPATDAPDSNLFT